ncbi:MAG: hypothetical protein M1465_00150 [Candidatus Marsarchaeota archaeon]|nr:hypothetical protein [Candidatus Marsarchaeota archaeon]
MSIRLWYYKHFDKEKLLEELSKPVKGEYIPVHDGAAMVTRVKKEELGQYAEHLRLMKEYYEKAYESCIKENAFENNLKNSATISSNAQCQNKK